MASTSAVRCTGTALRAAVIRVAVTGGLTLLACVFGSAVANAATCSDDVPQPDAIASTIQSDMSDVVTSLFKSLAGHQHHHIGLGGSSSVQPPADAGDGNSQGGNGNGNSQGGGQSSSGGGIVTTGQGSSGSGGDVWTGSTTVTVPTKTTPPPAQAPAPPPPPPPVHVQQAPPPVSPPVVQQAAKPVEPSMGAPVGVVPDLPQNPIDLPLQQPASQPISSPSTGSSTSHDLGNANGAAALVPPGTGFRPSPGSTTEEHHAKRVSDGVPGLPSTSPD